ncbi:MAG: hypothetical protein PF487_02575 [Bacteroidales bacterium]|jgi:photosystem II stability/assembly factor-like uncharacterized protein|nr:hypothetical protein [Bacteroidales bacterium]
MKNRKKIFNIAIFHKAWLTSLVLIFILSTTNIYGKKKEDKKTDEPVNSGIVSGLKLRSIGPAFASGRTADFAVNPDDPSEFFVAVASGHIWKTNNYGITFKPVFEKYGAYSIGCLAMDPNNHNVVWTGTGENNHQRALGYGNGVYKTMDGGKSWKNMGLKESRQVGDIQIDPRNSNIVFVAAEGSAWGPGGDRGLYKTIDGGKNWTKVLEISENTGVNNIAIDHRNPDIMYCTSEQRRRHVFTKIGGGPESAIYKSTDGGNNWRKLESGLPKEDKGGMGIAVSPVNPDIVYAIIEAANDAGGFYRSIDRGESWNKMSDHNASGQYYNEIYCDPIDVDKVYSVETVSKVTYDAGKTWVDLSLKKRHVDDHALWIDPDNTDHFMIGTDGGVYMSYDAGKNYYHVSNMPVTQFYRVAVDNEKPFYNVYGGTQDNNSMGGPSQNKSSDGVLSSDWIVTVGGDGFFSQIDPANPDIVYSEYQYGNVYRYDKKSGEKMFIKPQPRKNELTYKWNWNAPLIISPYNNRRLYIAANKVFKSDDRGESWIVISEDLTTKLDRNTWKVMGKYWSADAVAKNVSTSQFGTIVSLVESPVKEDLIYVGTDDGLIQVTEDAGKHWRKISEFPGIPKYTYVSEIYADRYNENIVYASFDNRKRDDFKPYLLKSTDKGKNWTSINSGFPENGTIHTIEQDHVNADLLFVGTEFGLFFSYNGGEKWTQLKSGMPDVAVRDLDIQRRENDLVLATFGRGFYILDDYSPLREINLKSVEENAKLFPVKDALMYIQTGNKYGQGSTVYTAKNPEFGATFTYYLKEVPKTQKQIRHKKEKELFKESKRIPQLTWKEMADEGKEVKPYLLFTIKDINGNVIRKLTLEPKEGVNRINWDLKYESTRAISLKKNKYNPLKKPSSGMLAMPGKYSVSMAMVVDGEISELTDPVEFTAKALNNTTLPATDRQELVDFQNKVAETSRIFLGTEKHAEELSEKVAYMKQAILNTPGMSYDIMNKAQTLEKKLDDILFAFEGNEAKASWEEVPPQKMPLSNRLYSIIRVHWGSTSAVTQTQRDSYDILKEKFTPIYNKIKKISKEDIKDLENALENAKAPWTPGRLPEWK